MTGEPCDLQVSASAARTVQHKLPEGVAAAVLEFLTGSLLCEIDDVRRQVTVLRVDHRADAYRPR